MTALRGVPGLARLDDDTLLGIVGDSANLVWSAGSVVIERDASSAGLYVVVSGAVQVLDEADHELAVLGPGAYFGEFALLLGTAHRYTVRAVSDSELMVVPKERFDALLAAHPDLRKSVREIAGERHRANAELDIDQA